MNTAIIALGSNIHPQENIPKAKELVRQKYKTIAESQFITTKALGLTEQADFLNGAFLIETEGSLEALNEGLKKIEISLGRIPAADKSGPRTIDLDIVVWNDQVIDQDFYERDFLKDSVLELLPHLKY